MLPLFWFWKQQGKLEKDCSRQGDSNTWKSESSIDKHMQTHIYVCVRMHTHTLKSHIIQV